MKNYEEFNEYRMANLTNEKFKKKKKIKKIVPQELKTKFNEFDKKIEEEETKRNQINQTMNKFINGASAFD